MNNVKFISVAASFALAALFALSCSSDSSDPPPSNVGGISSVVAESSSSEISYSSHAESSSSVVGATTKKALITGVFQKGPFVQGTLATLNELDNGLSPTGRPYQTLITDDKGTFELRNIELVSPYAHLIANGFYRNENTGSISAAPITLQAVTDITGKDNINVNIITHLEYYRVLDLVDGGMTVKVAKQQAQKEIFAQFGINSDSFKTSEDMSIFGTTEGDAALLAISILLQSNFAEGEFSQRLIDFSQAIRNGGAWNNASTKNAIADWASSANLVAIRNNIIGWGLAPAVPAFEKYVMNYWYENYALGECNAALGGVMKISNRGSYYICDGNYWQSASPALSCTGLSDKGYNGIAIQEPVLSCSVGALSNPSLTNTPEWANPVKGTYFVGAAATCGVAPVSTNCGSLNVIDQPKLSCDMSNSSAFEGIAMSKPMLACSDDSMPFDDVFGGTLPNWNRLEPGTYSVNASANCGAGVLNANCGTLTVEAVKLACEHNSISGISGSAITMPALSCNNFYFAGNPIWANAPNWSNPAPGEYSNVSVTAVCGSVTGLTAECSGTLTIVCMAYDNTDTHYCSAGVMKKYGSVTDDGGQTYKTVVIGEQTWMAENLNYNVSGSKCGEAPDGYDIGPFIGTLVDNGGGCSIYGRLYNWATAMNLNSSCNSSTCASQIQSKHRGICPEDWHIPSDADWDELITAAGGRSNAGAKLKATSGWNSNGNGSDYYGFSALPGGIGYSNGSFHSVGYNGNWWGSAEYDNSDILAYGRVMRYDISEVYRNDRKTDLYSVRCVQD